MPILELQSVTCGYGDKKIISGVSMKAGEGSFLGVIGPNGAGKTTLFRTITGILKPWEGSVLYRGNDIFSLSRHTRAQSIATMPQMLETSFAFTVEEFVAMGRFPHRKKWAPLTNHDRGIIEESMTITSTLQLRKRLLRELSGGERQRVILAQAFAQEPRLFLLDEPTAHLDIGHQIEILDLIKKRVLNNDLTVIMVLHDLNLASEYCDDLILLNQGGIYAKGSPQEVLTYQNIEQVYKTVVVVKENPISKKPHILPVSMQCITGERS